MPPPAPIAPIDARSARVTGTERARVGLLGLNAWGVVFLVPTLHLPEAGAWAWIAAVAAIAVLAAGLAALGERTALSRIALLGLYPPALGLAIVASPELVEREVFDPLTVVLGAASLLAYAAIAARACARAEERKPSTWQPSGTREPVAEPAARRWMRRVLLALAGLGGFAIVGVAPVWTDRTTRAARWGEAQDDGAVLSIVVATVTAAFAIGAIVGPGLRAERHATTASTATRRRLVLALVVAAAAALGWLALAWLDADA